MNTENWQLKQIQFRYSISYVCFFRVAFSGRLHRCPFDPLTPHFLEIKDLPIHLSEKVDFAAFNDLRIEQPFPRIHAIPEGLVYCLNQTQNYFIDLRGSFENYLSSFSPKTRSTLKRKVRKFTELSGGQIDSRVYSSEDQMRQYHQLARSIACRTYQEKLFHGALPETEDFCEEMQRLASEDRVRGFLLFLKGRPVAYLYVPLEEGVAEYAYLGYDPDFGGYSPGSVLLYLAIENLFAEGNLRYFNFGYGESQTKRMFSTGQFLRADVYLFRRSFRNLIALYGHTWMDGLSEFCGRALDGIGLRRIIKRWLRTN